MNRPAVALALALSLPFASAQAAPLDLNALWNFSNPAQSEQRFREALRTATGDEALILQTQIARSHGLRKDFAQARAILQSIADDVAKAGPEARARHALEMGRSLASATHPAEALTPQNTEAARAYFEQARAIAAEAKLDDLAIDAIHMLAFVDTAPADQLKWAQAALDVSLASAQPGAKRWEASVRNNLGYALHQLGRLDEALAQFQLALKLRQSRNNAEATRGAQWMVAWCLRGLGRLDEALAIQLRLEREWAEAKAPDPEVFEELELIYRAKNQPERAEHYAALKKAAMPR